MRALLALVLSVLLTLASQSEAVARFDLAGAQDLVICGADGNRMVLVDAEGKPLSGHPCSPCLAAGLGALGPAPPPVLRPLTRGQDLTRAADLPAQGRPTPTALARGPPSLS